MIFHHMWPITTAEDGVFDSDSNRMKRRVRYQTYSFILPLFNCDQSKEDLDSVLLQYEHRYFFPINSQTPISIASQELDSVLLGGYLPPPRFLLLVHLLLWRVHGRFILCISRRILLPMYLACVFPQMPNIRISS